MLTLKQATNLLKAAGDMRDVRMTRSYTRGFHRDVLIEAFLHKGEYPRTLKGCKDRVHAVLGPIAEQLHLEGKIDSVWCNWSENNIKLEMFCKVQLPEQL